MDRKHAAIVYNPAKIALGRVRRAVVAEEERHGWGESRWYATDQDDPGRRAAVRALEDKPSLLIIAGGDGTVRAVVEAVHESGTPLALLPAGTGNLLARNLGLPLNAVESSIRTAFAGRPRAVDLAVAEVEDAAGKRSRHVFLVMAGIGLDSDMASTGAESKKRLGWLAYVPRITRSVLANHQFQLRYRIDGGRTRQARAHTIIVGNCGMLTGNMLLIPEAKPDDGRLDVVMLRPEGRFGWARIGTRLTVQGLVHRSRLGKRMLQLAPDLRALVYQQGQQFDIRFDVPHQAELDGDVLGPIIAARVTVQAGALTFRV